MPSVQLGLRQHRPMHLLQLCKLCVCVCVCFHSSDDSSICKYSTTSYICCYTKRVKVAPTRLPSVGFRSWSRFLAVSLQVTWVINLAVSCHYFPPGLQLLSQPLKGYLNCHQFRCLVNRGTMGVNSLPKTVSRQRTSWLRFEPGPFCAWVQHANHSATEPPYRYTSFWNINVSKLAAIWNMWWMINNEVA